MNKTVKSKKEIDQERKNRAWTCIAEIDIELPALESIENPSVETRKRIALIRQLRKDLSHFFR